MPRGGHRVKPAKVAQIEASAPLYNADVPFTAAKPIRRNTDWKAGILKPAFLSRSLPETTLAGSVPQQSSVIPDPSIRRHGTAGSQKSRSDLPEDATHTRMDLEHDQRHAAVSSYMPSEPEHPVRPIPSRNLSSQSIEEEEDTDEAVLSRFEDITIEETQSCASSTYSGDRSSVYSSDSASIYSSASSIYSSGASMYSFNDDAENTLDSRLPGRSQHQQCARNVAVRRQEIQDAASRERSTLVRKAALFKNSRLPPQLPSFNTSLPTWSMVCRAVKASQDCYESQALTRRGTYTPADTSKDIKAMIVDDQLIDDSRLVIVSIRGTECQSLADWVVNKAANPVKPVGFLDDEENACHAGFLQVAKSMVTQVAAQLQQHPASSEKSSLLFTGHSAGGAVAAMLYSHMLSTSVHSDLTALASRFPSINCMTFGAPPISLTPLLVRGHGRGVFLTFANQGDPILRLSNAAYVKSLAKLMTASAPASTTSAAAAPPVKVVRHSRGTRVIRQTVPVAPPTPWEDLPRWPTPPAPLVNAGDVILLRDSESGSALAARVTPEDLSDVIFGDFAQHTVEMYIRRVKDVAFAAMMGKNVD